MKSVSTKFLTEWAKRSNQAKIVVRYCRNYWNGSAFVYERNPDNSLKWTQINMLDYVDCGQIVWKLDTPKLNTFKASNVTLRLKNDLWQWLPTNTAGIFGPDAVATQGYLPFLTMFQIQYGYVYADGSEELVNLITGVWVDENYDTQNRYVEVIVSGNEELLDLADAQEVSDTFTNETMSPSTGDGNNKVFTTSSTGVWFIDAKTGISAGGSNKAQGADYTLSGLNQYNGVVTVTFVTAPANGASMKATGKKWKTLSKIEDLIALLCTQAGIGASQRSIQPALFPGGTSQREIINTKAQWLAGTLTNTDAMIKPDSLALGYEITNADFETGDLTGWNATHSTRGNASVQGTVVHGGAHAASLGASADVGTTTAYAAVTDSSGGSIAAQTTLSFGSGFQQGTLTVPSVGAGTYYLTFYLNVGGEWTQIVSTLSISGGAGGTTLSFWYYLRGNISVGVSATLFIDDVVAHGIAASGTWLSPEIDLGGAPAAWGALVPAGSLNGGTWSFETQTSTTSGSGYESLIALDGNGIPQSGLKQYLKIKVTLNGNNGSLSTDGPVLNQIVLNFVSTIIQVAMANFSGKTCLAAIERLAQLCDYEFGFDGSGNFFFRSKAVSTTPVFQVDQTNAIVRLSSLKNGYAKVINVGQVTYNEYYSQYDSSSAPETQPTSQQAYRSQILSEDDSDILLAYDPAIAGGRAQLIHDNNYRPRRECVADTYIMPFADLSDVHGVTYMDDPKMADNVLGDPYQLSGAAGPASLIPLNKVPMKAIGITFKPDLHMGQMIYQEALS